MKGILVLGLLGLCICLLSNCTSADQDYFKGEIHYTYSYASNRINLDSTNQSRPVKGVFKYDSKNYLSQFINTSDDTTSYYYLSDQNVAVSKSPGLSPWKCTSYGIATDSVLSYRYYDTHLVIEGQKCKILEFTSRYGTNKYFVSQEMFLHPSLYKNHVAYNWKFYGDITNGGIILRLEHQFPGYTMTGTTNKLIQYSSNDIAFNIPENRLLEYCN